MNPNQYYRTSKLFLESSVKNEKTVLSDLFFTAPYKIMHPFYEKPNRMTVMLMSASAGVMSGDTQEFKLVLKEGAQVEFLAQEYEKIHKMDGGSATRNTEISVAKNASLWYTPQPTIPFKDSAFDNCLTVHLEDSTSSFLMRETIASGRSHRQENFLYRYYHNFIQIFENDRLIYRDNTRFNPDEFELSSIGLLEGYTHIGNLLLFNTPKSTDWIQQVREELTKYSKIKAGISKLTEQNIAIRILGQESNHIEHIFDQILAL